MAKYTHRAIFYKQDDGDFIIKFPEFEHFYSYEQDLSCSDIASGAGRAASLLELMLVALEENGIAIPKPPLPEAMIIEDETFVCLISCDTNVYRKSVGRKMVKEVPAWLQASVHERKHDLIPGFAASLAMQLGLAMKIA